MSKSVPDGESVKTAKFVLHEIGKKKPRNVADPERVFAAFQNPRFGMEKHLELMRQTVEGLKNGKQYLDTYRKNYVIQGPFAAFVEVMLMMSKEKQPALPKAAQEFQTRLKEKAEKLDTESPPLSSTRLSTLMEYVPSPPTYTKLNESTSTCNPKLWNFHEFEMDRMNAVANNPIGLPTASQETLVITELLYCLMGIDGDMFVPGETEENMLVQFTVSGAISETHRDLAREILPLASYYSLIQSFVQYASNPEQGRVLQALGSATRHLLQEYMLSLAKLESLLGHNQLSLQKMIYFLRPIMRAMENLANVLQQIRQADLRGGAVLTLLHKRVAANSGNEDTQRIFRDLTKHSVEPYMEMLKLWIFKGVIWDPQEEFLVKQNPNSNDWEMWYEIVQANVPEFLSHSLSKILRAGKYINVIRESKGALLENEPFDDENYERVVDNAYNFASSSLLHLIMDEYDLLGHFNSVKRFFLLQQGDFITQFMEESETELAKNVEKVIPIKLEKMLELRLRLSSANFDRHKDDLKIMFLPYGIHKQMNKLYSATADSAFMDESDSDISELTGIECFTFDYDPSWPVSIVLNHAVISKYQMIFRLLFYCKHTDRTLCRMWAESRKLKDHHAAFLLCQKMMTAIQNIEYYMMIEVIEPNWHIFFEKLNKVQNIDDVLSHHHEFLEQCLKNCMLTDPTLLKSVIQLCNLCLEFTTFIATNDMNNFKERVTTFSEQFMTTLLALLKYIREISSRNPSDRFASLIYRINYNSFYTERFDKLE